MNGLSVAKRSSSDRLARFRSASRTFLSCARKDAAQVPDQAVLDWLREVHGILGPVPAAVEVNPVDAGLAKSCRSRRRRKKTRVRDILSVESWNSLRGKEGHAARRIFADSLGRYLASRIAASTYRPWIQNLGGVDFPVHSDLATLRSRWDQASLIDLHRSLEAAGLFDQLVSDPRYGIPATSLTDTNPDMRRQWVTDSCMAGFTQRRIAPELWCRSMVTNAAFHLIPANVAAVLKTVRNPDWYRFGPAQHGVAHIFLPRPKNSFDEGLCWDERHQVPLLESMREDRCWGNRKRLESQALMAYWLSETLMVASFVSSDDRYPGGMSPAWGFRWHHMTERQKEYVIEALQLLMMYLLAVQWDGAEYDFAAPSVSSWEEAPLSGGCASDTGYMVDAVKSFRRLLMGSAFSGNSVIDYLRQRLRRIEIRGAESALAQSPFADFRQKEVLDAYIEAGERKLAEMAISPVVRAMSGNGSAVPWGIRQYADRGPDSSLALLAAHHETFSQNPFWDAAVRWGIVRFLEEHLMDRNPECRFGMKRYSTYQVADPQSDMLVEVFDSYINLDFHPSLIFPGLFQPGFEAVVAAECERIRSRGLPEPSLSPRDIFLRRTAERLATAKGVQRVMDTKKLQHMAARQHLALPEWSAQWSIGPTASVMALAKAKINLLSYIRANGIEAHSRELLLRIEGGLVRMINLCAAMIVKDRDSEGKPVFRADGTKLPRPYNIMEAFQACRTVDGDIRWIPGEHTLPWSASQLDAGLRLAATAAGLEEAVVRTVY